MNQREAQRIAACALAALGWQYEEQIARRYGQTPQDRSRLRTAMLRLEDELNRRGAGPGTQDEPDPNQVELFEAPPSIITRNPCCDDTGYSAIAAIPCENPRCTAVPRILAEHEAKRGHAQ